MEPQHAQSLLEKAQAVLKQNDRGKWTVPSSILYPHQWLWDSCFIAIGMRHYEPRRAAIEINSLFRGQWKNGMLPNIIFSEEGSYWAGPNYWQSHISEFSPEIPTSTITQPPLPALAAWLVAQKLPTTEAEVFLKHLYPKLLAYHNWLYRDRDPGNGGLVVLIHPWESGLDNTPPWMKALSRTPLWITMLMKSGGLSLFKGLRRDIHNVAPEQRLSDIDALKMLHRLYRFRKRGYNSLVHIQKSRDTVEDLVFNCILIASNNALAKVAQFISEDLPPDLAYRFEQTKRSLEELWDPQTQQYYSRHYRRQKLLKVGSIATFLPFFAQAIPRERADILLSHLTDTSAFWPTYPVPSAPLNSPYFSESRYWQGPTWINTNWMIFEGLKAYGYSQQAEHLRQVCLEVVAKSGFHEYFSPLSGSGFGINNFSWTAALTIELLKSEL